MSTDVRLLLVDDDDAITSGLRSVLVREGFDVVVAGDGRPALELVAGGGIDVVVLDVMLPDLDGRATLRELRAAGSTVPVILLTSVGEAGERARALDEGADDYLNKPFDSSELISRVRAVLRRARADRPPLASESVLQSGRLRMDRTSRRTWVAGKEVILTPKAAALLDFLLTHPDELITRERLLEVVWGYGHPVGTRAVDNRIAELRRALGEDPAAPEWITTVQGLGYRFSGQVEASR